MSVRDFEEMDTDEFFALYDVWREHEDFLYRDAWERARIVGVLAISPYSKRGLKPEKVLPLPWDKGKKPRGGGKAVSKEEDRLRLERLMAKMKG